MPATTTAPKLPLEIVNNTIDCFKYEELKSLIKQNIKMILLTYPGERIMQPDFGVGILRFLFDQPGSDLHPQLTHTVRQQFGKYLPSVNLLSANVRVTGGSAQKLALSVLYEIDFLQTKDQLDLLLEY